LKIKTPNCNSFKNAEVQIAEVQIAEVQIADVK